ncbi:uncharacterized protein LOC127130132 [Lathyrus oleraceus]|uniref:uncharacterized protein LOC127130132 n=1 Tax=Pisum sativum TaxID=3888 RepID=UPI0021D09572|nr:uncharacterized protein LOC127130132 [Pisum sativum]
MKLIEHVGLMKSVTGFGKCYEVLVKEFIVNIFVDCDDNKSKEFRKVFVREKCVEFSPNVINRYMGRCDDEYTEIEVTDNQVCKEITAKQVVQWTRKRKLSVGKLSLKYAILHRIGATNWVPTNHTSTIVVGLGKFIYVVGTKTNFDFENYVFEQTFKHVGACVVKMPIAFCSLICGIILSQHPGILNSVDVASKRESPFSLHYMLFAWTHVLDIVLTSDKESVGSTSGAGLIIELKDTCKALDDIIKTFTKRKIRLERLIKSLAEESPDKSVAGDAEEGDKEEEDVAASATSADESDASSHI